MKKEIEEFANCKLQEHGLDRKGWTFRWNRRKGSFGLCNYTDKTIEVSSRCLFVGKEKLEDTVLHEVAHALAGPGTGHGPIWKTWARRVGADPTRCDVFEKYADSETIAASMNYKYTAWCPNGCFKDGFSRLTKAWRKPRRCRLCHAQIQWQMNR